MYHLEWYFHITAINEFCNDKCDNYVYKASFVPSHLNEYLNPYEFKSEEECVRYLCNNFYEVYYVNKSSN